MDNRMKKAEKGHYPVHGTVHNVDASKKLDVYRGMGRVPMNDVSAHHIVILPAHKSFKEEIESVEKNISNGLY